MPHIGKGKAGRIDLRQTANLPIGETEDEQVEAGGRRVDCARCGYRASGNVCESASIVGSARLDFVA